MTFSVHSIGGVSFVSPIEVNFSPSNVGITNGCNTHSAAYTFTPTGMISLGVFISTLRFCYDDNDFMVIEGLLNAVKVVEQNGLTVFVDGNGV